MAITTRNKAHGEVTFQKKKNLSKGKKWARLARGREVHATNGRNCLGVTKGWKITRSIIGGSYCLGPILVHRMGGVAIFYGTSRGTTNPPFL